MLVMALLMLPMILLETPKEELLTTLPMFPAFLLAPIIAAFPFAMYGVISYPFYLLICKVIKKLTIEVELSPTELSTQPNNITDVPFAPSENDTNTNQGVE